MPAPNPWKAADLTPEVIKASDGSIRTVAGQRDGSRPGDVTSDGSLIFDADFANQPDWAPEYGSQSYRFVGDTYTDGSANSNYPSLNADASQNLPGKFDFFYTGERWHPNGDRNANYAPEPTKQPVGFIGNIHGNLTDPNGKSFVVTDESYGNPGQWGSDAQLTKDLGAEYSELWFEVWVRFQPGFQWQALIERDTQSTMKLLRCRRHSGITTNNRYSFFGEDAYSGYPVMIQDLKVWPVYTDENWMRSVGFLRGYSHPDTYGTSDAYSTMGDYDENPEEGIYQGGSTALSWEQTFGDGEWHKINVYLKMDSSPGAGDGIYEFWLDDIMEYEITDIPWRQVGDPDPMGWNECSIGGNMHNIWAAETEKAEQWYQVDEFKVYNGKPA